MRTNLGQMITEIQRAAAGMPEDDLKTQLTVGLHVLDDDAARVRGLLPGETADTRIDVTSDFMVTVITVALQLRELVNRPEGRTRPVGFSQN
jgi:hypothetical protein